MPRLRDLRAAAHSVGLLADAFVGSLRHNKGMGALALALSISIWVFVSNEQNPPRTSIVPFNIPVRPVNVPSDLDVLGAIEPVVVRVTAPSDLWMGFTEASFEATVDLTGSPEGPVREPVSVRARDGRVRVLEVIPPLVETQLDKLIRRTVPVQVNVQQGPPLGFGFEPPRPEVSQVTVLGPQQLVTTVDAAVADVNLSSIRANVVQSFPLEARSARGYDVSGVRIEPATVNIDLRISRQSVYMTLPVVLELTGTPVAGFWVSQVRVTPPTVAILGPQDVVQHLGSLKTAPVDVTNLASATTRTATLSVPSGITVVDRNSVQVEITVQPVRGNAAVLVAPQIRGLAPGLIARSDAPSVEVAVSGEGPALRDFGANRVQVYLNLEGRGMGSYEIEPQVELPPGLQLSRVIPSSVRVSTEPDR